MNPTPLLPPSCTAPSSLLAEKPPLQFGVVRMRRDQQEFEAAIDSGIESICETQRFSPEMSMQQWLDHLIEIIEEEQDPLSGKAVSYAWRLGFLVGQVAGILHPDLAHCYEHLPYLDALSCKYQALYNTVNQ